MANLGGLRSFGEASARVTLEAPEADVCRYQLASRAFERKTIVCLLRSIDLFGGARGLFADTNLIFAPELSDVTPQITQIRANNYHELNFRAAWKSIQAKPISIVS